MKFAKYQANNLIPEWRLKYLDYKKGKKLLKEVGKSRLRRSSSRASNPQTPNGNEADREDERSTPRSGTYGSVSKSKSPLRHRSPRRIQTPINTTQSAESTGPTPATVSAQAVSTGSDDSSTPIVPPPPRPQSRKSTFAKFSDSQSHIRQAFDSFKRTGRKSTTDSLEEVGLAKDSDLEYNEAELNFLYWLDSEIEKIDEFYQEKENDAVERYKLLSAQLDALRQLRETIRLESNETSQSVSRAEPSDGAVHRTSWVQKPIYKMRASLDGLSSAMPAADHERRAKQPELMAHPISTTTGYVEYRVAKRRLKQAILEFYRGMELLKGYRLLNRTGLSKILKKFDKTSGRKITAQYTEKLKSVHFDQSDSLENIMDQTENLYARYFERNNHKNAVERLRSRDNPNEHGPAVFNVGFFLGLAIPFFFEGIVISQEPSTRRSIPQTAFLLQVWGGMALILLFFLLFGVNCWVWHNAKINYTFIFEFDTKHHLDYRQYLELPTLLTFLGCVFFWLTFKNFWPDHLNATWYPLFYVGIGAVIFVFPFRTLHRSSRAWFAIANFRILFSGLYPIEFRDFFLGDQYNSLLYSFATIPLFFCLYAKGWDPNKVMLCNSSHSRVVGFFSTLPPIWRFFQCVRRYVDTRNVFPHLVNAGKYSATILMYTMLSLWRIDDFAVYRALFIVFATVNTLYCSWWDLFMDWSLMQPHAPNPFLRHDLGYKTTRVYYVAMVLDPIMRSSWLFYVVFPGQKQNSAATSFFLALGEVFRRFIWNFFRMENEHMTNVGHFIASRDVPLPFSLPSTELAEATLEAQPPPAQRSLTARTMGSVKRGMVRMTSSLRVKHAEDFARRLTGQEKGPQKGKLPDDSDFSTDNEPLEESIAQMLEETENVEARDMEEET